MFQDLIAFVLPVVGDVHVDSKAPMLTSSISKICWLNLRRCSYGLGLRACIHIDEYISRALL